MKKLIVLALILSGCGPAYVPTCNMTWTCGNSQCASVEGQWSGSGQFTGSNDEALCLAWETAFLNGTGYPNNRVTSCSCQ